MIDRELARVTRQLADDDTARLDDLPITRSFIGTVANATAGSYAVTWRGVDVPVAGKNASYTPVIGHRVKCELVDGQPLIAYRIDGQP